MLLICFLQDIGVCVIACILYVAIGIPVIISLNPLEIAAAVSTYIVSLVGKLVNACRQYISYFH